MLRVWIFLICMTLAQTVQAAANEEEDEQQRRALSSRLTFVTAEILQQPRLALLAQQVDIGALKGSLVSIKRKYPWLRRWLVDSPEFEIFIGAGSFVKQSAATFSWLQAFPAPMCVRNLLYYPLKVRDVSQQNKEFELDSWRLHKLHIHPFALQYYCPHQQKWSFVEYDTDDQSEGWYHIYPAVGYKIVQMNIGYKQQNKDNSCQGIHFHLRCEGEPFPKITR